MILRRLYDDDLAQASYLLGCAATGEALVVDPNRDVEAYHAAAKAEGLRITHVTETHIHADFVSGARELARGTGARLYLSDEGGEDWSYAYASESDAVLLRDGDTFRVGNIRVDVLHTPGHTPEHLSFLITDTAGADRPMGVLTGDFLFVGDVGRPDLLERAAKHAGTMEKGARSLFRSLQRLRDTLPDFVQIWPGHGAGSACGKSLGAVPQSTMGYERLFNWAFQVDEERFVETVLTGQPEPPLYFAQMKRINRDGPEPLHPIPAPRRLGVEELRDARGRGDVIVDTRPASEFARAHLPGSLLVPAGSRSFSAWAGSVLPFDRDLCLIADPRGVEEVVRRLALIGLDRVRGFVDADELRGWLRQAGPVGVVPDVGAGELPEWLEERGAALLDVRDPGEWEAGHIPGSRNLPLGRLAERIGEVPRDRPLVVHCQSGARAAVAIGLLRAHGFEPVLHLAGDAAGWAAAGRPLQRRHAAGVTG